jgi:hypothetical protein
LKLALEKIATVNAMDYEYQAWAREALAQPEPMLLLQPHREGFWCADLTCSKCYTADFRLKHASPLKRTWVGLTDDEIAQAIESINMLHGDYATEVAYAIESKLKDKNS